MITIVVNDPRACVAISSLAHLVSGMVSVGLNAVALVKARYLTAGRGPDACIDAVGMESHIDVRPLHAYDRTKQVARAETDRPYALREAVMACANGGVVSVIGAYAGLVDKFPMGPFMNRSLRMRSGQCHVHRYMAPLMRWIRAGGIDPSFVITHRMALEDAPRAYRIFRDKQDGCEKVVLSAA